jgi:vacuolar-type H+-ATPase subunit I/STV1
MNSLNRILTGVFIVFCIAGCSNVNLGKEIDFLLQTQFAGQVDEYVQTYQRFQMVSKKAVESLSGAQSQADSGGTDFEQSAADIDALNNQLSDLNKALYNKKLDIIVGILKALKEKRVIRDYKDRKLMEAVNQQLISAVKTRMAINPGK